MKYRWYSRRHVRQSLRDGGENRSLGGANLRGFVFLLGDYVKDQRHGYDPANDQYRSHPNELLIHRPSSCVA